MPPPEKGDSWDSQDLVQLQAQSPSRVSQAVLQGGLRVGLEVRPIHGLEEKVPERKRLETLGLSPGLRIHQLELVARLLDERRTALGADANPVDPGRDGERAVGLDGDFEAGGMQRVDERPIQLQEWFAARADHERTTGLTGRIHSLAARSVAVYRPGAGYGNGEVLGRFEASAARSVGSEEVRIAEPADGGGAVLFPARPQVAAGKPAEHSRPTCLGALPLEAIEDLFDRIDHWDCPFNSMRTARARFVVAPGNT